MPTQNFLFDALDNEKEHLSDMAMAEDALSLQGVCKDCGNGTLNNDLNPAFEVVESTDGGEVLVLGCIRCGSQHLDLL